MNLWHLLERTARERGDACALALREGPVDYRELYRRAAGLARALRERGIGSGDVVSIWSENSPEYLATYFAAAGVGAILNPLNTRLAAPEVRAIRADCESALLLTGTETPGAEFGFDDRLALAEVEPADDLDGVAEVSRGDPAQLYYTSGTTGRPKGVVLTHGNVASHAEMVVDELQLAPSDVWGHFAPMFHLADAWACFAVTAVGAAHAFLPRFEARAALRCLADARVTRTNLIPTMLARVLADETLGEHDLRSLRMVLSGGAPIAPAVVRRVIEDLGCEYVQTYGLTETSPYLTLSLLHEHLRELPFEERLAYQCKTGRPVRGIELEVIDDAGRAVAADGRTVGEIRVRGATVSPGYWRQPEATERAWRDGWFHTGDLAVLDGEGYVNIVDRRSDMILTGGENVYSIEVENALYEHPAVLEAAAFGRPDAEWGEAVHAAVVRKPGAQVGEAELRALCREKMAGYKVPKRIVFLSELPKTGTGKIRKSALREA